MKRLNLLVFIAILFASCMNEPVQQPNTYSGNFESLWQIIDTKYCFLDFKHINWDSIHTVYKARVDTVKSQLTFFDLMGDMLDELQDGHVNLISDFDVSRNWDWYLNFPPNFNSDLILKSRYLGKNYLIAAGFKYARIASGKVGYIYYSSFEDNFSDNNVAYMLNYFSACKGLIIDVRNNGGGSLDNSQQLASPFFKVETLTGYIEHKIGVGHSAFSVPLAMKTPANKNIQWQRPVIILTNRMSYSATNDFVNRMKLAPNAIIVGDKTGGGGGLPFSSELPNGWLVRFSSSPMFDSFMQLTEWGINPKYSVALLQTDAANGYDTIIEEAISLIK